MKSNHLDRAWTGREMLLLNWVVVLVFSTIAKLFLSWDIRKMDKIKRKKIELAGAHRACEFYGLNEGIDNHITTKDTIHMGPYYVVSWLWSRGIRQKRFLWTNVNWIKVKVRIRQRSWCHFNDPIWCLLVGCHSWSRFRNWPKDLLHCSKAFIQNNRFPKSGRLSPNLILMNNRGG